MTKITLVGSSVHPVTTSSSPDSLNRDLHASISLSETDPMLTLEPTNPKVEESSFNKEESSPVMESMNPREVQDSSFNKEDSSPVLESTNPQFQNDGRLKKFYRQIVCGTITNKKKKKKKKLM
uniref:Uncharacterized protein n=1 Tax=Cacopsylla melanoneura TaxID=428564 RepID=A0A8D9EPX3_9HEMI